MTQMTSYSEHVGDGIIQKLVLDFEQKLTQLLLHRWFSDELEVIVVQFKHVVLQHFEGGADFNVLLDLQESPDKGLFRKEWGEYLHRQERYISNDVKFRINNDPSLRIFYLTASCGLEGFIICSDFELSSKPELLN